jgi:hypothetical protein
MPKKTRREKIIADARRIIQQAKNEHLQTNNLPQNKVEIKNNHPNIQLPYQIKTSFKQNQSNDQTDQTEFIAIKKDLTKTIVLSLIAVAVEFIIYWYFQIK